MLLKISLKQSFLCLLALFSFLSNSYSQGRADVKNVDSGISSKHSNKWVDPKTKYNGPLKLEKEPKYYLKSPGVKKVFLKNLKTKEIKTYTTLDKGINLSKASEYEVTFFCQDDFGIKSVVTTAKFTSGGEKGFLVPLTVNGQTDENSKFKDELSASSTFNTTSEPINFNYNRGYFNIFIENAAGKQTKYTLEFFVN